MHNIELLRDKKVVVFGTGMAAQKFFVELSEYNVKIECFVDNDRNKWGKEFHGHLIIDPNTLVGTYRNDTLVVIASMYYGEISKQLLELGYEEHVDFIESHELYLYPLQNLLTRILKKYNFIHDKNRSVFNMHCEYLFNQLDRENTVLVIEHDEVLLNVLQSLLSEYKFQYVIRNASIEFEKQLKNFKKIKTIVNISTRNGDEIERLKSCYPNLFIIDLFEMFENVIPRDAIIDYFHNRYAHYFVWIELHLLKTLIQKARDADYLNRAYHMYLSYLLYIKDFIQFDLVADEYMEIGIADKGILLNMKQEINGLLESANTRISNRNTQDYLILILDAMRQKDITHLPALNVLTNNSLIFNNAFSPSTYTRASFIGMFSGARPDGYSFEDRAINGEHSMSLNYFMTNNYLLYQHGGPIFDHIKSLCRIGDNDYYVLTSKIWEAYCRLYSESEPQVHLIHAMETHYPFLCARHVGAIDYRYQPLDYLKGSSIDHRESDAQYGQVLSYVNDILEKSFKCLSSDITLIICSDHGGAVGGSNPTGHLTKCDDEFIHVPLIIYNQQMNGEVYDQLFSMRNFDAVLFGLFTTNRIDPSLFSSTVIVERDPIYNSDWRSDPQVATNLGDWILAFRMIRNHQFKYILFENGHERLYKLPDESNNVIMIKEFESVLGELRKKLSTDFSMYRK